MLYRPKFCCECGDKIERVDWKLFTSRRFCAVCESEHKLSDLLPVAAMVGCLLLSLFALGTYLQTRSTGELPAIKRTVAAERNLDLHKQKNSDPAGGTTTQSPTVASSTDPVDALPERSSATRRRVEQVAKAEPIYYCGAATKKGSPCTRRVKGKVRCWQHEGMPAMESREKAVAAR